MKKLETLRFMNLKNVHVFRYIDLPNSSDPTDFDAIELVNAKAAQRKSSNGGTIKTYQINNYICFEFYII